jgi:hypothetical protein
VCAAHSSILFECDRLSWRRLRVAASRRKAREVAMAKQLSEFVLDKRILERNLKKGLITAKELEEHLAKLSDVGEKAEVIRVNVPGAGEGEA